VEVHAFVLLDSHYHLLVRTPEPNLSEALRWMHVTYSIRFNRDHRQGGHVFQGRFKAVLIETHDGVVEMARYLHLNPVRVGRLALAKAPPGKARAGGGAGPGAKLVRQRLLRLKNYPWSSWRVYQGAEPAPEWLETSVLEASCGGRSRDERRRALRAYTEAPVREGWLASPWTGVLGGVVLGSPEFARQVLKGAAVDPEQDRWVQRLGRTDRWEWPEIVRTAEQLLGRPWSQIADAWGDWGRDATMYVAIRYGRHRLVEVVRAVGLKYYVVAQAVRRFGLGFQQDPAKVRFVERLKRQVMRRKE
jgi:hypothetical protein